MQPQNPNNYWQPGDQPAQSTPPHPVGPAPQAPPVQPQVAPSQPVAQPQQPIAPAPAPVASPAPAPAPVASPAVAQPQPVQAPQPVVPPANPTLAQAATPGLTDQAQQPTDEVLSEEDTEAVSWEAQEFIHQEKTSLWFAIFTVVLVILMAAAILLMKSWSFAILLVVIAAAIIVFAKRPPRTLGYSLTNRGLYVGETLHPFKSFKAFGVIHDGAEYSIMLIPTKRFMPGITVYFPEEYGEEIVDILGSRLPMQELHLDLLDRVIRKIRL